MSVGKKIDVKRAKALIESLQKLSGKQVRLKEDNDAAMSVVPPDTAGKKVLMSHNKKGQVTGWLAVETGVDSLGDPQIDITPMSHSKSNGLKKPEVLQLIAFLQSSIQGLKEDVTEEGESNLNEVYNFDFEDWDNSDIAGQGMQMMIDGLIEEVKVRINESIDLEANAIGGGVNPEEVKRSAAKAIKQLWIERINSELKF